LRRGRRPLAPRQQFARAMSIILAGIGKRCRDQARVGFGTRKLWAGRLRLRLGPRGSLGRRRPDLDHSNAFSAADFTILENPGFRSVQIVWAQQCRPKARVTITRPFSIEPGRPPRQDMWQPGKRANMAHRAGPAPCFLLMDGGQNRRVWPRWRRCSPHGPRPCTNPRVRRQQQGSEAIRLSFSVTTAAAGLLSRLQKAATKSN